MHVADSATVLQMLRFGTAALGLQNEMTVDRVEEFRASPSGTFFFFFLI